MATIPKFQQIVTYHDGLYALDASGCVWMYVWAYPSALDKEPARPGWRKLSEEIV